ncbi:hypothetical protein SK128_020830, partial [Halocaridina rubra]
MSSIESHQTTFFFPANQVAITLVEQPESTNALASLPPTITSTISKILGSAMAKLETKALKAKRPGFSEERYNETSYYIEN